MLGKLLFRLVWGVTKLAIRFVVIPILISAAVAALLGALSERLRENAPEPNGRVEAVVRLDR